MERYYQPEIETASREQIRAWQDEQAIRRTRERRPRLLDENN